MEIIKPFLGTGDGMSLQCDTKKYWSRIGEEDIKASKDVREPYTCFMVSKASGTGNQIVLKADNGKYLTLWGSEPRIVRCTKTSIDEWCIFSVYDAGDGYIALQGRDSKFISRWGSVDLKEGKEGIDQYCKLKPGYGSLVDPKFEILKVEAGKIPDDLSFAPEAVDRSSHYNEGSQPVSYTYELSYEREEVQSTTWNASWGFGINLSYEMGVPDVNESSFSMTINYNYEKGGSSSKSKSTKFVRSITVKAAPKKETTATLVLKRCENAKVPFTATIKRRNADGTFKTFEEGGTWSGIIYSSAEIVAEDKDL